MNFYEKNRDNFIQYLKRGCKPQNTELHFGVELEHFIVKKKTGKAVSYYGENGVEAILKRLQPLYAESAYSEGQLIALAREDISISLEPAAQLEVSISPQIDIDRIDCIYKQFVSEITPVLEQFGYEMITTGYQPASKVEDLELIPKKRYCFMDQYFSKFGPYGRQMMRGTAATQVSIDYYSEEDFMLKYELAYRLKDILPGMFENTPIYEGIPYKGVGLRQKIWKETDFRRVDVTPFMHNGTLSFGDYVDFVMKTPVIVGKKGEVEYYDEHTIGELCMERELTEEELVHCLSMVFPMIRAKQFLEIRYVDSLPMERVLSYVHLIKALFTNPKRSLEWLRMENNMTLNEIEAFYKNEIAKNLTEHERSGKVALDYLDHSTAKYKGKTIYSLYVPKILNETTKEHFKEIAETMAGIMRKVIATYQKDEEYRVLFGFSKKVEKLILQNPLYENLLPVCRVDIFYNEKDGSFYFCEFNTDGSSSMNEDRELCKAFEKTQLYRNLNVKYEINSFELFDSLVDAFLENYNSYPYKVLKPTVAIVDFLELGCSMEEFEQFHQSFEKKGLRAYVCDIRNLHLNNDRLCMEDGTVIDLIYRRAVTSDICEKEAEVTDFLEAVEKHKVCCMGGFCTQVAHDKSLFYILRHNKTKEVLTEEENRFIEEHIPYTEELTWSVIEKNLILEEKEKWLIKPKNSYGARGIFAGVRCSEEEWKKVVTDNQDKNYIVQQFVMPYQTANIDFHKEVPELRNYSNLTGLYVYNGKFAGVYSRQSANEIISSAYDENDIATVYLSKREGI